MKIKNVKKTDWKKELESAKRKMRIHFGNKEDAGLTRSEEIAYFVKGYRKQLFIQ